MSRRGRRGAMPLRARGVALLTVLLVTALVTIVAVGIISRQRHAIMRTQQVAAVAQARAYALGAETFARELLAKDWRDDREPPRTDSLADEWAKPLAPFEVDCGALQVRVRDAQQGFNVNAIALGGTNPALTRLRTLLAALQLDPQLADGLKDWIDADQDVTGIGGEDSDYLVNEPGYRTGNAPMADVSEANLVGELDADQRGRLLGALDALPVPRARVNVNTAGPYALIGLVPNVSLDEAQAIAAEPRNYEDPAQFVTAHPQFGPAVDALAVTSDFFEVRVRVDCSDTTVHLQSLVHRDPANGATRVLRRNFGRIWFNSVNAEDDDAREGSNAPRDAGDTGPR